MSDEPRSAHLAPETLAAYLDGLLPPEERARVEATIAADPETYEWVLNATRVAEELGEQAVPAPRPAPTPSPIAFPGPAPRRRPWMIVAGSLALAAAVLLAVRVTRPGDPMAGLVEAVGEQRYVEARLTGGFRFGPLQTATRGPAEVARQNLALLAEAGELQKRAQANPSAVNQHAWGVAQALLGDYDGAVESLEDAFTQQPDQRTQSDLAAVYSARAREKDDAEDWARALDHAVRVVRAEPSIAEAWFIQALAAEALGLPSAAQAWEHYLERDASSGWADEARRRLEALRAKPPAADQG